MANDETKPKPEGDGIAKPEDGGEFAELGSDPEGTLRIQVSQGEKHVIVKFGKEVEHLNLTPEQAVGIATVLMMHARAVAARRVIAPPGGMA